MARCEAARGSGEAVRPASRLIPKEVGFDFDEVDHELLTGGAAGGVGGFPVGDGDASGGVFGAEDFEVVVEPFPFLLFALFGA